VNKFDAIVVGAGPAGSTAAYLIAKAGLSVLVAERGEFPGAKNTSGAVLYGQVLDQIMPDFRHDAPVERQINNQVMAVLAEDSSVEIKTRLKNSGKSAGLSVLRSKFDRWLAQKASEAGALIMPSTLVEDILWQDARVVGVKTAKEQGEVLADIVIIADGANSLLVEKANLGKKPKARYMGLAVKELLKMPADEIMQRFQLSGDEGVAYSFIGASTQWLPGGGFFYTNHDSISIGLIVNLRSLEQAKSQSFELLDRFKAHPSVAPLISGYAVKEYSAHLIPEGGYNRIPKLFGEGVLVAGDAAGLTLNSGFTLRGMDLAIASGAAAAETVKRAREKSDYSSNFLSYYQKLLENGLLRDMKRLRRFYELLQQERLYRNYPAWVSNVANRLYSVGTAPGEKITGVIKKEKPSNLGWCHVVADMIKGKDL